MIGMIKANEDSDYEICDIKKEYEEAMHIINIIDSIATLIVPLVLIVVMNIMIMRTLFIFNRRFKEDSNGNSPRRERSDIDLNQIPVSSLLRVLWNVARLNVTRVCNEDTL